MHHMDEVRLQISGSLVEAAAAEEQLVWQARLGPVVKARSLKGPLIHQNIPKMIHRHGNIDNRLCLDGGDGSAPHMLNVLNDVSQDSPQPGHGVPGLGFPLRLVPAQQDCASL